MLITVDLILGNADIHLQVAKSLFRGGSKQGSDRGNFFKDP